MISLLLVLLLLILLFFVPPANNVEIESNEVKNELASENKDKGKSILGTPPKLAKNETKNPRAKKGNNQKPKQKKQHLYHHYGAARLDILNLIAISS